MARRTAMRSAGERAQCAAIRNEQSKTAVWEHAPKRRQFDPFQDKRGSGERAVADKTMTMDARIAMEYKRPKRPAAKICGTAGANIPASRRSATPNKTTATFGTTSK